MFSPFSLNFEQSVTKIVLKQVFLSFFVHVQIHYTLISLIVNFNKSYYTVLLSLKSAFYLFISIIVTKFVQYLKLNENTMFNRALDRCSIVFDILEWEYYNYILDLRWNFHIFCIKF